MTNQRKSVPLKKWAEAEALWANGDATRKEIAKKLGVSESAVQQHMAKAGVKYRQNADQHRAKIADAVQQAATEEASIHAQRIRETKNEHYAISQNIAKLVWQEVLTAKKNGQPLATAAPNLKALDIAISALAKARMERWAVLGLDRPDAVDTNELATLEINELTAGEIEELRERNFNDFEMEETEPVQETVEVKTS